MEASAKGVPSSPQEEKPSGGIATLKTILDILLVPILAVFSALVIGGLIIVVTETSVYSAFRDGGLLAGLAAAWQTVAVAYGALFSGSLGDADAVSESLVASTPFIFAGLAVAFAFRGGLFNIGAEGQLWVAAGVSVIIGFSTPQEFLIRLLSTLTYVGVFVALIGVAVGLATVIAWLQSSSTKTTSLALKYLIAGGVIYGLARLLNGVTPQLTAVLPESWSPLLHLPLAIIGGFLGGALYGAIPGYLKARTGAHEVINTIMMNFIAFRFFDWAFTGPLRRPGGDAPVTAEIFTSAYLPRFFAEYRIHWGFILALLVAFVVWWLLFKTTLGFEIRTVGANPNAARYGGIKIGRIMVLTMAISGGLAGLAGTNEVLGVNHFLAGGFSSGYGFEAIALALLGKSHPLGVVLAALLFGTLRSGATRMQSIASIPVDIISIVQALVIVFIAAPAIVRWIYRIRIEAELESASFTRGWGG